MLQEKTVIGKPPFGGWTGRALAGLLVLVLVGLAFGYGYFFGRYEQIALNKSVLKAIPDVNCAQK